MANDSSIFKYSNGALEKPWYAGPIYGQVLTSDLQLSRPEWKKVFFMQMLPPHINQNGSG